jgi:S-adenosylmethionine:tRNA ribosyltransferase-isomerase
MAVKLSDFDFDIPERLIAQHPMPEREQSRLMVVRRGERRWEHRFFRELPEILTSEHLLVMNNSRVFPARLRANRPGRSESIEVLLVREIEDGQWLTLVKPARKAPVGQRLEVAELTARVTAISELGLRVLAFEGNPDVVRAAERIGEAPLPPYIHRPDHSHRTEDVLRYQTVYAKRTGSIAAPTAGLHFTPELLGHLKAGGVACCEILLHVGYGTFQPIRVSEVSEHRMLPEYFEVSEESAALIRTLKASGRRLVAVGTTTTRVLEYLARDGKPLVGGASGMCDLFIHPGFRFRIVDGLLTNFHLPKSTPFLLACAFADRELMLECYREARDRAYRFYSFGDAMLIV